MKNAAKPILFVIFATISLSAIADTEREKIYKQIAKRKWWDNCVLYGKLAKKKKETVEFDTVRDWALNQDLINGIDLMNVSDRTIAVGMSTCGVYASIGLPVRENRTTNAFGSSTQLAYENRRYRYIYTRSSKERTETVTAFSE